MQVSLQNVEDEGDGWIITLKAELEPSAINQDILQTIEDWKITFQNNCIYLQAHFDLSEPWEDIHLEEIKEAALREAEWRLERINTPFD